MVLVCISLITNEMSLFMFTGHLDFLFGFMPVEVLNTFFYWVIFFLIDFVKFFIYLTTQSFVSLYVLNIFSHFTAYLFPHFMMHCALLLPLIEFYAYNWELFVPMPV